MGNFENLLANEAFHERLTADNYFRKMLLDVSQGSEYVFV